MTAPADRTNALVPAALLAATVFFWGTSYWPTEIATEHTSGLTLAMLRVTPAALIFLLALPLTRSQLPRGRLALWALLTGPLMIALFQWGVTEAVARAGPGNSAVLVNTPPLFVLVLGWIFLRERVSPLGIAGLLVGFGGVVLMVSSQIGGTDHTGRLLSGIALALAASLGWAIGTLILKWLSERREGLDMIGYNAGHYLFAGLLMAAVAFGAEGVGGTEWGSGEFWAAVVWVGPVGALGVLLFFLALTRLSATRTSAVIFLVPAVAVVVEIARGNSPTAVVLVGMFLAVAGVALVNMPAEQAARLLRHVPLRRDDRAAQPVRE